MRVAGGAGMGVRVRIGVGVGTRIGEETVVRRVRVVGVREGDGVMTVVLRIGDGGRGVNAVVAGGGGGGGSVTFP
jgi:hypothetical protein